MHMFNVSILCLYHFFFQPDSFMHMFNVSILCLYQIAPLKAVIGVDRPLKASSMHIHY